MRTVHRAPPGGHTVSVSEHRGRRGRTLKHTSIEHIGKGGIVTHRFGHAGDDLYGSGSHEKKHVFTDRKGLMAHLTSTMGTGDPGDAEAGGEGGRDAAPENEL